MDVEKMADFLLAPIESFVEYCDFGRLLSAGKTSGVLDAIASAGIFFVTPGYDVWKDVCDSGRNSFISRSRKGIKRSLQKNVDPDIFHRIK